MKRNIFRSLGKFLALILRHSPEEFGVSLDSEGYADIEELLRAIKRSSRFRNVTIDDILYVVKSDEKGRFEVKEKDNKLFIRALYGHSRDLDISISYELANPDSIRYLYHGTQEENLEGILSEGLKPQGRKYVHLSATIHDAEQVARRRRGRPVILVIDAKRMIEDGFKIYKATRRVFLTDYVPPKYIVKVLRIYKK